MLRTVNACVVVDVDVGKGIMDVVEDGDAVWTCSVVDLSDKKTPIENFEINIKIVSLIERTLL